MAMAILDCERCSIAGKNLRGQTTGWCVPLTRRELTLLK